MMPDPLQGMEPSEWLLNMLDRMDRGPGQPGFIRDTKAAFDIAPGAMVAGGATGGLISDDLGEQLKMPTIAEIKAAVAGRRSREGQTGPRPSGIPGVDLAPTAAQPRASTIDPAMAQLLQRTVGDLSKRELTLDDLRNIEAQGVGQVDPALILARSAR